MMVTVKEVKILKKTNSILVFNLSWKTSTMKKLLVILFFMKSTYYAQVNINSFICKLINKIIMNIYVKNASE